MTEVSHVEELNNVANLKASVTKLPFKLRERWRSLACNIQEERDGRVKLKELAEFIKKQAKVALHPVFGDIKDSASSKLFTTKQSDNKELNKCVTRK